jgi:glutamate synthase (NADPH/NADH) large chain
MSGGVAFVYKLRADHVNHEALAAGELHMNELEAEDVQQLRALLEQHVTETDSALAKSLLQNFDAEVKNFTIVLPRDYANVLKIRAKATEDGVDPDSDSVWKQILEVTNG